MTKVPHRRKSTRRLPPPKLQSTEPDESESVRDNPMSPDDWMELFPSGISVQTGLGRPVLVLKDKHDTEVLPVWMHPLDAGLAIAQLSDDAGLTPHSVTMRILELESLKIESCTFVDLIGHQQYVQLSLKKIDADGKPEFKMVRLRASEAMSFCLHAKARFFSSRSFMQRSRSLQAELGALEQHMAAGVVSQLQSELEISSKKPSYVM